MSKWEFVIIGIMLGINFIVLYQSIKEVIKQVKEIRRLDGWINYISGPHSWSDDVISYEDFIKRFDEDKEFRKLYSKKRRKYKK